MLTKRIVPIKRSGSSAKQPQQAFTRLYEDLRRANFPKDFASWVSRTEQLKATEQGRSVLKAWQLAHPGRAPEDKLFLALLRLLSRERAKADLAERKNHAGNANLAILEFAIKADNRLDPLERHRKLLRLQQARHRSEPRPKFDCTDLLNPRSSAICQPAIRKPAVRTKETQDDTPDWPDFSRWFIADEMTALDMSNATAVRRKTIEAFLNKHANDRGKRNNAYVYLWKDVEKVFQEWLFNQRWYRDQDRRCWYVKELLFLREEGRHQQWRFSNVVDRAVAEIKKQDPSLTSWISDLKRHLGV